MAEIRPEVASEHLSEDSISSKAIDFEDNSFAEKNGYQSTELPEEDTGALTEEELDYIKVSRKEKKEEDTRSKEDKIKDAMKDIASAPIEEAMSNMGVSEDELIMAAKGVFEDGFYVHTFKLPFGGSVTLSSRSTLDNLDYAMYIRRLGLEQISNLEYETLEQIRNLTYAIAELDGEDYSILEYEERYDKLLAMGEAKVAAIINHTSIFWKTAHILLHPGLVDFLEQTPEE